MGLGMEGKLHWCHYKSLVDQGWIQEFLKGGGPTEVKVIYKGRSDS